MEPKLIKTDVAEYSQSTFDGVNKSGIQPLGDRVLVLADGVQEKTSGGVHLPDDIRERHVLAAETGVIVDMGSDAFLWNPAKTRKWESDKPKVGDYVFMNRYSGVVFKGDDGQSYRLMDDTCIGAVRKAPLVQDQDRKEDQQ